jgi:hypothetical protein
MPDQTYSTEHEREAFELGAAAGIAAASWVADGNTSPEHYARVLAMTDDGDPQASDYLPAIPNLSGEWADAPTPHTLYREITGNDPADRISEDEDADGEIVDAIADAWEAGVASTFESECERILRAMAPEPCVCAGTGDHTGQGIADCDECNPAKYEEEN